MRVVSSLGSAGTALIAAALAISMTSASRLLGTNIRPSKDVVLRLRDRIRFPASEDIRSRLQDWKRMFFVFGGVMSGLLVMMTIARALYYFVGKRHM